MTRYIYGLADPRDMEIQYIGVTRSPIQRLYGHRSKAKSGSDLPLYRWFRRVGTPVLLVLQEVEADYRKVESEWILRFPLGLNLQL